MNLIDWCGRLILTLTRIVLCTGVTLGVGACAAQRVPGPADGSSSGSVLAPDRYDARLSGVAYPFKVRMHRFESQRERLEMVYMDLEPERPNGRAVLLLHGKNFSGASWARTARDLRSLGYRVIIPDQIGFGKSSKPGNYQYSFAALATNTLGLLDAIGVDEVTVVGHSMGGMLATRFALLFPERTRQLVLVNPIGLEDWQEVVPYRPVEWWYENELNKTPEGVRAYMRESYYDGNWAPEYESLAALQMNWALSRDKEQLAWVSAKTYDMIFTQPVVHDFPRVSVPTLLIIGTRDRTALGKGLVSPEVRAELGRYDRLGKRAAQMIPDAQLVELEGIGHIPQVEAYERYIDALTAFLAEESR